MVQYYLVPRWYVRPSQYIKVLVRSLSNRNTRFLYLWVLKSKSWKYVYMVIRQHVHVCCYKYRRDNRDRFWLLVGAQVVVTLLFKYCHISLLPYDTLLLLIIWFRYRLLYPLSVFVWQLTFLILCFLVYDTLR